jgi:hypothetical protein
MKASDLALILGSLALAGCSAGSSLSTGSLFGGSKEPIAQAAPTVATSDPTSRAFQVGTVSARAVKCGYNFDPQKLRASFMAAEVGAGAATADIPRIEQIYDVAFNGVTKASAADPAYCTEARTKEIKAELARHLAGDYAPAPRKQIAADSGGIFGDLGKDSGKDNSPKYVHPSEIP